MFSYIYKDLPKFEQTSSEEQLKTIAGQKKEFKAFEWKHKPTSIRMVEIIDNKIVYSEWHQ